MSVTFFRFIDFIMESIDINMVFFSF